MRIKKGTYLVIALLLACSTGMAQSSMSFTISPIAITTSSASVLGGTVAQIEGGSKCLSVANGLRAVAVGMNSTGTFGSACVETVPVGAVVSVSSVTVFPNPTHSLTTLKVDGSFDTNLSGQVRIISMDGRTMMSQMIPMSELKSGHVLNVAAYAAGTYVVSVDFKGQHYTTKLIKI